jgi:hypothetical protein
MSKRLHMALRQPGIQKSEFPAKNKMLPMARSDRRLPVE